VFKFARSMREIESVVREEAEHACVQLEELRVEQGAKLGLLARYRVYAGVSDAAARFRSALGQYVLRSQELR